MPTSRSPRALWSDRVRRWKQSGLTAAAFASREALHPSTLRWWASRLRREARPAFVELRVEAPPPAPPGRIELLLAGDRRIHVEGAFDVETLRRLVAALEAQS